MKKGLEIIDLGVFKLRETEDSEVFYVNTIDTYIFVSTEKPDYKVDILGKIVVHHDGLYFGNSDQMYDWIASEVTSYLKEKGNLVKYGETILGEILWELKA